MTVVDRFHPSEFIQDELDARGWDRDELAIRMGGNFAETRAGLEFYMEIGATTPQMFMGEDTARQLANAFGTSYRLWLNLERAWRSAPGQEKA